MQLDMFSQKFDLGIARPNPNFDDGFHLEDLFVEKKGDYLGRVVIKIARSDTGYHYAVDWFDGEGGVGSPVRVMEKPAASFEEAKFLAIQELRDSVKNEKLKILVSQFTC